MNRPGGLRRSGSPPAIRRRSAPARQHGPLSPPPCDGRAPGMPPAVVRGRRRACTRPAPRPSVADLLHQPTDRTAVRIRAIRAQLKRGDAGTGNRRERSVDDPDHLAKADLVRRTRQTITPALPAPLARSPCLRSSSRVASKKFARNVLRCGDVGDVNRLIVGARRQHQESAKCVFCFLRKHRRPRPASSETPTYIGSVVQIP